MTRGEDMNGQGRDVERARHMDVERGRQGRGVETKQLLVVKADYG